MKSVLKVISFTIFSVLIFCCDKQKKVNKMDHIWTSKKMSIKISDTLICNRIFIMVEDNLSKQFYIYNDSDIHGMLNKRKYTDVYVYTVKGSPENCYPRLFYDHHRQNPVNVEKINAFMNGGRDGCIPHLVMKRQINKEGDDSIYPLTITYKNSEYIPAYTAYHPGDNPAIYMNGFIAVDSVVNKKIVGYINCQESPYDVNLGFDSATVKDGEVFINKCVLHGKLEI